MMGQNNITLKRVYDAPSSADGARILVDRLWPQGLSKTKAALTLWMKEIAPSSDLRKWYHQDRAARWNEFCKLYRAELISNEALNELAARVRRSSVTLLFAYRNPTQTHASTIKQVLLEQHPDLDPN